MAKIPSIMRLTGTGADLINGVRNAASAYYQQNVNEIVPGDLMSLHTVGAQISGVPALKNEFLNVLVNRIGLVLITSKMYENPWKMFKKGVLEMGDTVEEIFTELAKPYIYNPADAEQTLYKREIPDVRAAYHTLNYKIVYPVTIQNQSLRAAFTSFEGVDRLIASIVESVYKSANYDEFLVMKYIIAREILDNMYIENIDEPTATNAKSIVSAFKQDSNALTFMSNKYNRAKVHNYADKNDQYLISTAKFDAIADVEVMASAFNLDKAEFMGHRLLVDTFVTNDEERLALLFANDPNYKPFTEEEKTQLETVAAVIIDKDFFMIYDNVIEFTETYNAKGLYWNYFLHNWKTFSTSPFANAIAFCKKNATTMLNKPTSLTWDNSIKSKLSWTASANATGYQAVLYKDSVAPENQIEMQNVTGTNVTFANMTDKGNYIAVVKALGNGVTYTDSNFATSAKQTIS